MTVYFGVKYYAPDPCKLAEEITRYQFFLQCKQDILNGRLPIPFDLAIELFALAVQSELGDYDPQRHPDGYIGEFQFLPGAQTLELERRVALFHRQLGGQVPATAELNFLERVKWLDLYGCDLHPIQYDEEASNYSASSSPDADEYALGLNPSGVSVLRNKLKVAHYVWTRIVKTKSQGRCFLMDVMGNLAGAPTSNAANNNRAASAKQQQQADQRQRFGFRLADKQASRRLRLSLEQHKSFYHLINNSATLNRLVAEQHHRQKLSQRFRHSIRSAIQLGGSSSSSIMQQQHQHQQHQQHQHQQLHHQQQQQQQRMQLRSSMKSSQYDGRQQPTVVRMPSRRYSKNYGQTTTNAAALSTQHAHTMLDHQRQQALAMMSQLNQIKQSSSMQAKSQTLKPVSSKQASANREKNQYYHQMMMAMMANQQQQQQHREAGALLAPGQHVLHPQPNIYKATSVINGINQLAGQKAEAASMMQQLFSGRPQYPSGARGHESPRSTKSAIAPSSALKLASKKLAKQQQQLLYGQAAGDIQPLLGFDPMQQQQQQQQQPQQMYSNYYGVSTAAYNANRSTNASPRSARSARVAGSRNKSKSISDNLHLLHNTYLRQQQQQQQQQQPPSNKMLLATATQLMQQQQMMMMQQQQQQQQRPPPPNYNGKVRSNQGNYSDNESELGKQLQQQPNRKRATFALTNEQANILLSAHSELSAAANSKKRNPIVGSSSSNNNNNDDDDYCCSRSDCSSLTETENNNQPQRRRNANSKSQKPILSDHKDWNSIRRRHEDFSRGKAFQLLDDHTQADGNDNDNNNNNNSSAASQLVKNIANKQATPILLSMNYELQQSDVATSNNNKAVQLLNLQRQQLNSSGSSSSTGSGQSASCESVGRDGQQQRAQSKLQSCSESSSVASASPKQQQLQLQQQQQSRATQGKTKADSTVSNSTTTSGYYAGSNSTGSASADSDSQQSSSTRTPPTRPTAGSRAQIALGSYSLQSRMSGDRLLIGNQAHLKPVEERAAMRGPQQKQQFYLGDPANNNNNSEIKPLMDVQENWQQQPASLKYVSFDV